MELWVKIAMIELGSTEHLVGRDAVALGAGLQADCDRELGRSGKGVLHTSQYGILYQGARN